MGLVNLFGEQEWDDSRERPAGQRTFPYHYEYGNEEWLLCVSGRPTLRTRDGGRELAPGDVVCFPEGPDGAHQVINTSGEPARVLILSTRNEPGVAFYPDSDKIGVFPENREDALLLPRSSEVDYFEGED